jgi:hypothetical protein
MGRKVIEVSNILLIPWGMLSLIIMVYFFILCAMFSDEFFFHKITRFLFIFSIFVFVLFVATCTLLVLFMYGVFSITKLLFRVINFIILALSIVTTIVLVTYCFYNKENFLDTTLTYIISYPNDRYTKNLKIKLGLVKSEEGIADKVKKYISARTEAPGIAITCFFIPWLILYILMLRSIRNKSIEASFDSERETKAPQETSYNTPLTDGE